MSKRTRFIKKANQSATQMQPQPPQTVTPLSKWYQNINELPLYNFEECLINNNLSSLIISGYPTPQELQTAWENIMTEYTESLGNSEYTMYVTLYKQVEILRLEYEMICFLIAACRKHYSPMFCSELNRFLRINLKFDIKNTDLYFADVDKCERRSKAKKIQLDLKLIEFDAIKNKFTDTGVKIDKKYFTSVLIILSKHNNYRITKSIFVNEYCEYLRQFNLYCDQMNKQAKK
jgi:hypothetical protein